MAKKSVPLKRVKALKVRGLDPRIRALLHSYVNNSPWIIHQQSLAAFHSQVTRLYQDTKKYLAYKQELSQGNKAKKVAPPVIPSWLQQSFGEDKNLQKKTLSDEAIAGLTVVKINSVKSGHIQHVRESMLE